MKKLVTFILSAALITGALFFAGQADAFLGMGGDKGTAKPPPAQGQYKIHDEETFKNETKAFHLIPFGDVNYEFEIFLPSDWLLESNPNTTPPDLSKKIVAHIAEFTNPENESYRAVVTIEAMQVDHEIDAKSWLRHYLLSNGLAPDKDLTSDGLRNASTTYVNVSEGRSSYTYITVELSGNIAVMARFELPAAQKDSMGFLQQRSIDGFKLIYPREETIEEQKVFTLVDSLKFAYPASWQIEGADFKDLNRLSVQLHNRTMSNVLEGFIRFYAVRRGEDTAFKDEVATVRKYFTDDMKVEFTEMKSSTPFNALARFPFGMLEVYNIHFVKGNLQDQEFRILALADPEWYIFVTIVSPLEANDPYTWARNARSFDLIIHSFK